MESNVVRFMSKVVGSNFSCFAAESVECCAAGKRKDYAFGGVCVDRTGGASSWYAEDAADDSSRLGHWTCNGVVGVSQGDGLFFLSVLLIPEGDADDVGEV